MGGEKSQLQVFGSRQMFEEKKEHTIVSDSSGQNKTPNDKDRLYFILVHDSRHIHKVTASTFSSECKQNAYDLYTRWLPTGSRWKHQCVQSLSDSNTQTTQYQQQNIPSNSVFPHVGRHFNRVTESVFGTQSYKTGWTL